MMHPGRVFPGFAMSWCVISREPKYNCLINNEVLFGIDAAGLHLSARLNGANLKSQARVNGLAHSYYRPVCAGKGIIGGLD